MTCTAIRRDPGLWNGRETVVLRRPGIPVDLVSGHTGGV